MCTGASLNEEGWGGTRSPPTSQTKERGRATQGHGELQEHWHCRLIGCTGSSWLRGNRKVTEGITRWLPWIMTPSILLLLPPMQSKCWSEVVLSHAACLWNDTWFPFKVISDCREHGLVSELLLWFDLKYMDNFFHKWPEDNTANYIFLNVEFIMNIDKALISY